MPRSDWKGPRRVVAARLPIELADRFTTLAEGRGVTLTEALAEAVATEVNRLERSSVSSGEVAALR